jgi:hypothetical protein
MKARNRIKFIACFVAREYKKINFSLHWQAPTSVGAPDYGAMEDTRLDTMLLYHHVGKIPESLS